MSGKLLHFPQQAVTPAHERPAAAIVGRDAELAVLHQRLERALQGQRQMVFLAGEPGIGKTALVDTFLAQIRDRDDIRITSGQCVEQYGPGEAYLPLLEATSRLCRGPGGERRIAALQRYAPSWLAQLPGLLEPHELELLQQRVQGTSRERMLREMAEAAEGFTLTRGLVLVLEDLHWSDVSTLEWVMYMARRREPAKLLILGTYRPADVLASNHSLRGIVQELRPRSQCEELQVTPLGEVAIADYLRSRFGKLELPGELVATLARRTGGNPLFIVIMVDDLLRQGVLVEDAGQWTIQVDQVKEADASVPDSLRHLIERQPERLPEAEQYLLEVASVVGVEFAGAEVTAGLQTEMEDIETICERFTRMGQWLRAAGVAEWPDGTLSGRYGFLHALYHEVVYARLAEVRRIQLHRRIAERKEAAYGERAGEIAAELAVHFEQGRDLTRAVQYLGKAGENAVRRSAHQEAIRELSKGLELLALWPDTSERTQQELTLLVTLGPPFMTTKGFAAPETERTYARALELCRQMGDLPQIFPALWGLRSFYALRGELQTAQELADRLLRLAQNTHDSALLVEAHHAEWATSFWRGELVSARNDAEQGVALYNRQQHHALTFSYGGHDPGVCCRDFGALALWLLGYPEQALRRSQEALALAGELSHPFTLTEALGYASWLSHFCQEEGTVYEWVKTLVALSKEHGFSYWLAQGTLLWGWVLVGQGQEEEGLRQMHQGLAALRATGAEAQRPYYLALLAKVYERLKQTANGLGTLTEALEVVDKIGARYYEAELYRLKGELLLNAECRMMNDERKTKEEEHDPAAIHRSSLSVHRSEEAEACFLKALGLARQQQAKSWELRAATSLARLWQQQDKVDDARQLLEEIYSWFTEGFDTKDLQDAEALLRALGSTVEKPKNRQAEGLRLEAEERSLFSPSSLKPTASSPSQSSVFSPQPSSLFRCESDYWTVEFDGVTCRLKDSRGLHYLAFLLHHPNEELSALRIVTEDVVPDVEQIGASRRDLGELVNAEETPLLDSSDAGELLDPQARAAYKQKLTELQEELEEAQEFHDLGRVDRLQEEMEFLTRELSQAIGLGGRVRKAASTAERARLNVTRAIHRALDRIAETHPRLGQYLTRTIKTGNICVYTPDPHQPVTWEF